jgi:hypothetical protein
MIPWRFALWPQTNTPTTTRCTFNKRFLKEIEVLMVQVLMIARTMGVLKLGNIALDDSKLKANASKHSALSDGHIKKLEDQLQGDVTKLMALAEAADNEMIPDGMNLPDEIARREDRLKVITQANIKIEARSKERFEQEYADYQATLATREATATQSRKPARGTLPVSPVAGARDKDQINLTDEESRIKKVAGGGFAPCDNVQIAVDMDSLLIVTTDTVQACNDKQQVAAILTQLKALPVELGQPVHLVADTGYFSEANVKACGEQALTPLIAMKREAHHPDPLARVTEPPPLKDRGNGGGEDALCTTIDDGGTGTLCETHMHGGADHRHHQGDMGIPSILASGLEHVTGEWNLVAMACNLK